VAFPILPLDTLALDLPGHFLEHEMLALDDSDPDRVQS